MTSELINSKMAIFKARAARGELTEAEVFEAMTLLRAGRTAAVQQTAASRTKRAAAAIPDADELVRQMMGAAT